MRFAVPAPRTGATLFAVSLLFSPWHSATASTLTTIYSFCPQADCTDGAFPQAALIMDASGNLYGTTPAGGDVGTDGHREGTVFELIPNANKTAWTFKRLHSFCAKKNCSDGAEPTASLILDTNGNLYGTTSFGGVEGRGNVFELSPTGHKWSLKVLHEFCKAGATGCTDGVEPNRALTYAGAASGLPYDGTSPLYGVTPSGGSFPHGSTPDAGTVFVLKPGAGGKWSERVVYSFCANAGCNPRLPTPSSALVVDASGKLYGTTSDDGFNGNVFRLASNARGTHWTETTPYTFCALAQCADGQAPEGDTLFLDGSGNLYGTTEEGGNNTSSGVVFKLNPAGPTLTVLYDFCSQSSCADGGFPLAGVIMDSSGNLFGTTSGGGSARQGTVFELSDGGYQTLYSFCSLTNCTDGSDPEAGLIADASGNLFGTTISGGANGSGTVFEVLP
jgi:uncharacterized repeat protein (TIGR03803 family)